MLPSSINFFPPLPFQEDRIVSQSEEMKNCEKKWRNLYIYIYYMIFDSSQRNFWERREQKKIESGFILKCISDTTKR